MVLAGLFLVIVLALGVLLGVYLYMRRDRTGDGPNNQNRAGPACLKHVHWASPLVSIRWIAPREPTDLQHTQRELVHEEPHLEHKDAHILTLYHHARPHIPPTPHTLTIIPSSQTYVEETDPEPLRGSETTEQAVRRASQLVWVVDSNEQVDRIYRFLADTARGAHHPANVRAMAVDALMRSNNSRYLPMARELLGVLRHDERRADLHLRTQQAQVAVGRAVPTGLAALPRARRARADADVVDDDYGLQAVLAEQLMRVNELRVEARRAPTVYEDTQNVHNHTINKTVAAVAAAAAAKRDLDQHGGQETTTPSTVLAEVQRARADDGLPPLDGPSLARAKQSLDRMQQDRGQYQGGSTIREVLARLYRHMETSPYRTQLLVRLGEELQDMHGLCATGHLSRLVNVVQGFDDTPAEFRLRVDAGDEIYATLSKRWGERVAASEELMDALVAGPHTEERQALRHALRSDAEEALPELLRAYHGVLDSATVQKHIGAALIKYVP